MNEPKQNRHKSKQDYGTPDDLWKAVCRRWGTPCVDLAAHEDNTRCDHYIGELEDSLSQNWFQRLNTSTPGWLNPPYGNIAPWLEKCHALLAGKWCRGQRILVLIPTASLGTHYFSQYAYDVAKVIVLSGRLTFKGCTAPFPKDCMILEYPGSGFEIWNWRLQG